MVQQHYTKRTETIQLMGQVVINLLLPLLCSCFEIIPVKQSSQ